MSTSVDGYVDITDVVCPLTFVKTKVVLERKSLLNSDC